MIMHPDKVSSRGFDTRTTLSKKLFGALLLAAILGGCAQLGPQVLTTGRPLYNVAVAQTESEQLLLNIVRQRYNDPLLFLDVTSISSGFSRGASANLLGTLVPSGRDVVVGSLGANIGETPFITYAPNTGEKFVRQMLTPLDLRTVALIVQAGWSIERVLLIIGESVNQVRNTAAGKDADNGYLKFQELAAALRDLQRDGLLSVGAEPAEKGEDPGLTLMIDPTAVDSATYRTICEAIRVACDGGPLRLRQAIGISSDGKTMALATRSLFSALYFLAQGVDVPSRDTAARVASGSSYATAGPFDQTNTRGQLFRVRTSATEPSLASVKVFYRDAWFYVADDDIDSKVTFALVSMLVMLQSGDTAKITPLISLPVN